MPVNAVIASAVIAVVITLPALYRSTSAERRVPVAFFAVVSIGVIGLYVAFAIPIYLRWRAGRLVPPGNWNLGNKYKWIAPLAVIEIVITSIYLRCCPTVDAGRAVAHDGRPTSPGRRSTTPRSSCSAS